MTLLNDIHECVCESEASSMQTKLTEFYRVIRLLMDETFKAQHQDLKVLLANLEYQARQCKQTLEE